MFGKKLFIGGEILRGFLIFRKELKKRRRGLKSNKSPTPPILSKIHSQNKIYMNNHRHKIYIVNR